MKTNEITAADYQQTMSNIWDIVRNYCTSEEEAKNTITMTVENYLYDMENGASVYRAIQTAMEELYIEPDYMMEFAEAMTALNVEKSWDDNEEEELDEFDDYDESMGIGMHIPFVCRI